MARDLGWEYFEKLAKQRIMQVQSASDPPKKLALGERAVMVDGTDTSPCRPRIRRAGQPVYASEGSPLIIGPNAIFKEPQSERRAAVPGLLVLAGMPAALHRRRRHALRPPADQEKPGRVPFRTSS